MAIEIDFGSVLTKIPALYFLTIFEIFTCFDINTGVPTDKASIIAIPKFSVYEGREYKSNSDMHFITFS